MSQGTTSRLRAQEDRLLKRYRSYRGTLIGSAFLAIVMLVFRVAIGDREDKLVSRDFDNDIFYLVYFFIAIAVYANAKLQHIRSIKSYRLDNNESSA